LLYADAQILVRIAMDDRKLQTNEDLFSPFHILLPEYRRVRDIDLCDGRAPVCPTPTTA